MAGHCLRGAAVNITWKTQTAEYSNGEDGFVGKWMCFQVNWNSYRSKTDDSPSSQYRLLCRLPGVRSNLGAFSLDGAKVKAQAVLDYWLKNLNAEIKT